MGHNILPLTGTENKVPFPVSVINSHIAYFSQTMQQCPYCPEKRENVDLLISHIKKFHSSVPNLNLPCGRSNCPKTFKSFGSRFTHISRYHNNFSVAESQVFDEIDTGDINGENLASDFETSHCQDDVEMTVDYDDFIDETLILDEETVKSNFSKKQFAEAQFILGLRSKGLSQLLVTKIIENSEILVRSFLEEYHEHVNKALQQREKNQSFIV